MENPCKGDEHIQDSSGIVGTTASVMRDCRTGKRKHSATKHHCGAHNGPVCCCAELLPGAARAACYSNIRKMLHQPFGSKWLTTICWLA
jgi:hypothetical protein